MKICVTRTTTIICLSENVFDPSFNLIIYLFSKPISLYIHAIQTTPSSYKKKITIFRLVFTFYRYSTFLYPSTTYTFWKFHVPLDSTAIFFWFAYEKMVSLSVISHTYLGLIRNYKIIILSNKSISNIWLVIGWRTRNRQCVRQKCSIILMILLKAVFLHLLWANCTTPVARVP